MLTWKTLDHLPDEVAEMQFEIRRNVFVRFAFQVLAGSVDVLHDNGPQRLRFLFQDATTANKATIHVLTKTTIFPSLTVKLKGKIFHF